MHKNSQKPSKIGQKFKINSVYSSSFVVHPKKQTQSLRFTAENTGYAEEKTISPSAVSANSAVNTKQTQFAARYDECKYIHDNGI